MREHRHYKEKLFREGKLVTNDKEDKKMTELEQLNERITQLTELVKSGEETISATKEMLKLAERERDRLADQRKETEPKFERVKFGHGYHYMAFYPEGLKVCKELEDHTNTDKGFYINNNYFHTKERAQEVADKINLLLRLERLHDIYCPNCESGRYYISQNTESGRYCYSYIMNVPNKHPTSTMFPSEEIAIKVCDILNKELEEKK
jgi:hypothetical protein